MYLRLKLWKWQIEIGKKPEVRHYGPLGAYEHSQEESVMCGVCQERTDMPPVGHLVR